MVDMWRYLYSSLLYLLLPFVLIRLLWRSRHIKGYRHRWAERFGWGKIPSRYQNGIWIHVVSVGEALAAAPLIQALSEQQSLPLIITTTTPTGSERVEALLPNNAFHCYCPYDLPGSVNRFLNKAQPKLAIFMETEIWPNVIEHCYRRHIPTLLANARLSDKSKQGYQKVAKIIRPTLHKVTTLAIQYHKDAQRFKELGVTDDQILITGNMKFDMPISQSLLESAESLRQQWGNNRPIFVAASTHEGEEDIILQAFQAIKKQHNNCLLVLVPRHPDRFDRVYQLCQKWGYSTVRRSETQNTDSFENYDIYLGDTMGELRLFCAASDIAFVGGSLIQRGGHNLLEPAAFKLPVITGPHTFNFEEATTLLQQAQALTVVSNAQQLAEAVNQLLSDPQYRTQLGESSLNVVEHNRGALKTHLDTINQLLWDEHSPT